MDSSDPELQVLFDAMAFPGFTNVQKRFQTDERAQA
jgi:hypothetical protein